VQRLDATRRPLPLCSPCQCEACGLSQYCTLGFWSVPTTPETLPSGKRRKAQGRRCSSDPVAGEASHPEHSILNCRSTLPSPLKNQLPRHSDTAAVTLSNT